LIAAPWKAFFRIVSWLCSVSICRRIMSCAAVVLVTFSSISRSASPPTSIR